jgi:transcription antitermination factor NusG
MLDGSTAAALASDNWSDYHQCYSIRAPRWAVVYTHPQAERWADSNLTRRGYVTYLPLAAVRVRDRVTPSMLHTVQRPLFSRYLFIRFNHLADSWSPIRDTPGVLDLVRSGPDVHYAPEAAVSVLQAGEAARRCQVPETTQWAPGVSRIGDQLSARWLKRMKR